MAIIYQLQAQQALGNPTLKLIVLISILVVILRKVLLLLEKQYAVKYKRPVFLNVTLFSKSLTENQFYILNNQFSFYQKLNTKQQSLFRHRLATFIDDKSFKVRDGLEVTDEMKTLIGATAIMLTFGFRNYLINLINAIIIYPKAYYSQINETYHKGETNPKLKAIVFSWEDFDNGYRIGDDNLNLGIHEFGHAIHLNTFNKNDVSSLIFKRGFEALTRFLEHNENIRQELIASKYFRAYAYTNQYEFFAVLLENFIETPSGFKSQFPELYTYVKQMLNFNFAGY
jgi:Mlc titration factor MtfA (ptsG expression regulator)